jgi:hypothetical protein
MTLDYSYRCCVLERSLACAPVRVRYAGRVGVDVADSHQHRRRTASASNARAEVKLDTHFDVAVQGNAVHFELVVKNVGGKHAELNFADGQAYDFVVADSAGRDVWQWSNGRIFTQSVRNKQLGGGESMRVSESWNRHNAAPGHYTVTATLKGSLSSRAARRIHDPVREL